MLIDTYGRQSTDLRVSLTDRCNLRCTYCMPEEGLQWLAKPDLLALRSDAGDEEIARIWREAMWGKKAGAGLDDPTFVQPDRPMSAIGG
ncbi:hypothetical protein ACGFWE_01250 [Streptomyces sp. NPDC048523]|uniref:hypothetical protein n=1 Tax=Streptomyces sp. NPDC048523 TaxID=3365567 RepID=UPI0037123BE8